MKSASGPLNDSQITPAVENAVTATAERIHGSISHRDSLGQRGMVL